MASPSFSPGQNFLNSLTLSEQRAFAADACERTFPRGSTPIREGVRADYVMVIVEGRTRISVLEDGRDRFITERGPGQLIGEVGTLRVNARSATVTVTETVQALVMRTRDFARFLSDHQRVRIIVESQIDDRLTEEPYRWNALPDGTALRTPLAGENCTVLVTDVVGFGALDRNDTHRRTIRIWNLLIMWASLGPLWEKCLWKDLGDGLLIVVPPLVPTALVMEFLHRELPDKIKEYNLTHDGPTHIRLRAAADVGPVAHDPVGLLGETIIRVCRMIDAPVLRDAMVSPAVSLGLIVSSFVYDTAIKHADGWACPLDYQEVEARVKESRIQARMRTFGPPRAIPGPAAA